jgi:GTP cyclohydrolase I
MWGKELSASASELLSHATGEKPGPDPDVFDGKMGLSMRVYSSEQETRDTPTPARTWIVTWSAGQVIEVHAAVEEIMERADGRIQSEEGPLTIEKQTANLVLSPEGDIEEAVYRILKNVGEDPEREGLRRTPHRVAKAYSELLEGYGQDVETILNGAMFDVEYGEGEMVVVSDIEYSSMCEHHMLPFTGKAHVAYLPGRKVIGLSKIPRIVDMFTRRLQVQERLTNEIADALVEAIDPRGAVVVVEGQHSCATLRGVKKHGVNMTTTAQRREFKTDRELRDEFYRLIGK